MCYCFIGKSERIKPQTDNMPLILNICKNIRKNTGKHGLAVTRLAFKVKFETFRFAFFATLSATNSHLMFTDEV